MRPGGLEEGLRKESGPRRQAEGSSSGRTSPQAMQEGGSGAAAGLNKTQEPNLTESSDRVVKRCQRSKPPTTWRIGKRSVVRAVSAVQSAMSRRKAGLRQVDLDEAPARTKSASRTMGDEEEMIGGKGDRSMK